MELRLYRFPEWLETEYKCVLLKRQTSYNADHRADPVPHDGRMDESLSRSRRIIKETILCNPFDLFCTFTFDKEKVHDRTDYKALKKRFSKALDNFKQKYDPHFKYMYVPELHKDGAVHFHGVMTAPYGLCSPLTIQYRDIANKLRTGPNTKGYMNWPYYSEHFGFFSASWIRNYTGCAVYVSKYMTKELANWFARGDQIVMKSKGLIKPELVHIDYEHGIPGQRQQDDYDGEYCAVAMRSAYDVADLGYINPDDRWHRYADRLDDGPPPTGAGEAEEVTDPIGRLFPGRWRSCPGPVDAWEQIDMMAKAFTGHKAVE